MNDFSYVEKLLDGVEVVWFPISEVTERTTNIKWRETSESHQYIDLTSVSVDTKKIIETTEVKASNAPSRAQKLVKKDDVLFATTRPTQMRYCLIDEEYDGAVASTGYCVLRVKRDVTLPKWILHLISSSDFKKYLEENQSGSAYPAISDAKVKDFSIPIPCPDNPEKSLAIQAEIVRILDAFTAMTAELTAELNMRKKQYNYYREKLLASELPSSKTATLGEILDMRAGKHIKAKDISAIKNAEHKYTCFGGNGSRGFVQEYSHEGDYALIGRQGALCGNVKRAKGKFYATEHAVVCTPKEEIDIDWAFHMLTFMNLNQYKSQSAQPGLAVGNLANLTINVPTISEQRKIAKILNKFDALTNSITEGLPREIELRQKQYEYYRDLLLNFPACPAGGPKSEEVA
ncbi:TPA: restriction endonuclease subunit S [Vibrio parahaemolyticus]|nr:restriction endonuclease subunit S [Vibrio parahaemolyticus]